MTRCRHSTLHSAKSRQRRSGFTRRCNSQGSGRDEENRCNAGHQRSGAQHSVEPRRTLVDAIREDCGQTGTHIGCEHRRLRGVHRADRWCAGAGLPDVCRAGRWQGDPDCRGPGRRRQASSAAAGVHGLSWSAVRLLYAGIPDAGDRRCWSASRRSATRTSSMSCLRICAVAPAIRTSSKPSAWRRSRCGRADVADRTIGPPQGGSPSRHRQGNVCRGCLVSASTAHADRALALCAWLDQEHRYASCVRIAGRRCDMDRRRCRRYSADRFSPDAGRGSGTLSSACAGAGPRCVMSASLSPRYSPPTPI